MHILLAAVHNLKEVTNYLKRTIKYIYFIKKKKSTNNIVIKLYNINLN